MDHSFCFNISRLLFAIGLMSALAVPAARAQGGTLRIGEMTLQDNQYVIPVVLDGAENQVSAMNFRLHYDPAVFQPVLAQSGQAALDADKVVTANSPEPGEYVVVMMGLNQTSVPQGEVARVVMQQVSTPESGRSEIFIADSTLATADGLEIPSRGMSRTVDFADVEPAPADPGEETPPETPEETPPETPDTPKPGSGADDAPIPGIPEEIPASGGAAPPPRSAEEISRPFPGAATGMSPEQRRQQLAHSLETAGTLREGLPDVAAASTVRAKGEATQSIGGAITPKNDLTDTPDNGTISTRQEKLAAVDGGGSASAEAVAGSDATIEGAAGLAPAGYGRAGISWVTMVVAGGLIALACVGVLLLRSKRTRNT